MSELNKNGKKPHSEIKMEDAEVLEAETDDNVAQISDARTETEPQAELEKARNELLYLRADFDNYRKRISKEQEQSIKFANERLIRELAGVLDLLDRGLTHGKTLAAKPSKTDADFSTLLSGVDLTLRELVQVLTRFGAEFFGTVGEKFDPNRHEAISSREDGTSDEPTVVDVLQRGCMLNGRLLSPAKVVVAQKKKDN